MKKIILLSLLFSFHLLLSTAHAQDYKKIDSLKKVLNTLPALNGTEVDTMRMKTVIDIGNLFKNSKPDSAIFWFSSIIDTVFSVSKIKQNPRKAYFNTNSIRTLGVTYFNKGDNPNAIKYYEKSLIISKELGDKKGIYKCLINLGNMASSQGDYPRGIEYYEKSLKISEELGNKSGISSCLTNLGLVFFYKCDYPKSIECTEKALQICEEIGDKNGISICLSNLSLVFINQGDYPKAILCNQKSLKISEELIDQRGISSCLTHLGLVYSYQCDYQKAINYHEKSLKLAEELGDKSRISACFRNLGLVYSYQGDYPKAVNHYEKSLKIFEEIGDERGISYCLSNLAIVFYNQGDYPKAIKYYEKSLKIAEELGDESGISSCLHNIGMVFKYQGDYPKAIEYYEKSLKIFEKLVDKNGISICLINLGNAFKDQSDYPKAILYYEKALKIDEEIGDKRGISICLNNLGNVFTNQSDYSKAIEYYEKSLKIEEELGMFAYLADFYPNLASAFVKQKKYNNATLLYLKSVQMKRQLIQDNFSILSEKEKGLFLEKTGTVFNTLNEFATITNIDSVLSQCYNNTLLLKGLLLNSSGGMLTLVSNSTDTNLTNTFWQLKMYRDRISKLYSTPKDERKESIDSLQNLANNEERKLVKLSSEFADIQKLFTYKWEDVQKNLSKDEAAIEFVRINNKLRSKNDSATYAAFILRPGYKNPEIVSLFDEKQMQNLIKKQDAKGSDFIASLYSRGVKPLNSNMQPSGDSLYAMIWKPMLPYVKNVKTIYYAPAGMLHQIAFSAIANSKDSLISDIYDLRCVASTSVLIKDKTKEEKPKTISLFGGIAYDADTTQIKNLAIKYQNKADLAMARSYSLDSTRGGNWNYLPGTLREVQDIKALSEKQNITTTFYSAENATEESFKFLSGKASPDIIHIATHGFFFPNIEKKEKRMGEESVYRMNEDPLFRSGLLFSGANYAWKGKPIVGIEDGILTAYEVGNLNLKNTKLVVLSACETGLGDIKGSEGVYGLQRAFKMAGVKYIIMSLWQVPDKETSEFMKLFYTNWFKNGDIRKSFTETQREMRKKYAPYYWAAFVLVE